MVVVVPQVRFGQMRVLEFNEAITSFSAPHTRSLDEVSSGHCEG